MQSCFRGVWALSQEHSIYQDAQPLVPSHNSKVLNITKIFFMSLTYTFFLSKYLCNEIVNFFVYYSMAPNVYCHGNVHGGLWVSKQEIHISSVYSKCNSIIWLVMNNKMRSTWASPTQQTDTIDCSSISVFIKDISAFRTLSSFRHKILFRASCGWLASRFSCLFTCETFTRCQKHVVLKSTTP